MATYYSTRDSRGYRLELDVVAGTQSIPNNTTIVSYTLYMSTGNIAFADSDVNWSINIDGKTASGKWTPTTATAYNSRIAIPSGSGTFTITHTADGTKTISISASSTTSRASSWSPLAQSLSGSMVLTTIPRASQPSLNVSTQALGSAIIISTNRASTSFTHTLTYAFGNQSGTIATGVATSQSWTLPIGLASAIPNAPSGTGTITCTTYNGTSLIGSKSVSFTATVPNNSTFQPTATISSIVQGTTLPSGITVFVQNQSKAKVTSTGTGKYSATISTYSVSVAGIGTYTGSVITSATLQNSGSVRVTLTVTDSRGLKGSTYQDIDVVAYSPPQLPTFNASRSESTPSDILANFDASISPINNQNHKYFRIRSKASDGSWVVETESSETYVFSGTQTIVSDPDKSYEIEFFFQDSFTSITRTVQVGTAFTLMDFNASGKGIAIGKVSESDSFEIAMDLKVMLLEGTESRMSLINSTKECRLFYRDIDNNFGFYIQNDDGIETRLRWTGTNWNFESGETPTVNTNPIWHAGNSNVIEDSGSNENGNYVKFSDGTQICWNRVSFQATFTSWGNLYSYDYKTKIPFPADFIERPRVSVTNSATSAAMIAVTTADTTGTTQITLVRPNVSNGTYYVDYIAVGRWK